MTIDHSTPPGSAPLPVAGRLATSAQAAAPQARAASTSSTPVDRTESANKWVVLALAGGATLMTTLDASIVNIGLPSIAHSFGVPLSGSIEWVIDGYLVVIAALLLTLGRVSDMVGRKPVFLAGVAVFTLGSAVCGAAPSLGVLIAARCVEGLGGAGIFAVNVAMITRAFPVAERGRALGTNAILVAMGVSLGPTLGGILTQIGTWRWIFYVNVPIGVIVLLAAWHLLTERAQRQRRNFDLAGATFLAVGLGALTLGLSFGQEWGWSSPRFLAAILVAVTGLALAVWTEGRARGPVLDLALFRNRVFASTNLSLTMAMLALFAVGFLLPFYFEELRGYSTLQSGLLLTPFSLSLALVAPLAGRLADRVGSAWLAPTGLAIACGSLLLLSTLTQTTPTIYVIICLVAAGIGQGLFMSPNSSALMGAAPREEQGEASGVLATSRVVGQSLSVAVAGAVFTSFGAAAAGAALEAGRLTLSSNQVAALQHTFVTGLHAAFLVCAALATVGVLSALVRGKMTA